MCWRMLVRLVRWQGEKRARLVEVECVNEKDADVLECTSNYVLVMG
jgi:hypothetical protein